MKKLYFLLFSFLVTGLSYGQVIVAEGFSYPDGSLVPNGGWASTSGTSGDFLVSSEQGVIQHGTPSEDVEIAFAAVSGDIYAAFDFSVDDLGAPYSNLGNDFEYFAHFSFRAQMDIIPPSGAGDYSVGISSDPNTAEATWSADLTYGTIYRAIIKFNQDTGTAQLWIDPTVSTDTSISGSDDGAFSVTSFDFRQSDSDENETIRVDDLMIGQTFNDVLVFSPPTDPTLTLSDGPANGSTFTDDPETAAPGNATIDFVTTNFVMSTDGGGGTGTGGDGFIKWTVENTVGSVLIDSGDIFTSNDGIEYPVTGLMTGETYFFRSELVDNAGNPLSSPVVYSFTITIATYNDIMDIATLRGSTVDPDIYYRVTGQVINTFTDADTEQTMFFQDATGGIKVYDPDYEIQSYNEGDAVSNIRGYLESVNGVLQFVPTFTDWGTPDTTGNVTSIPTVTIATLLTDWEDYESELVNINGVTFADGGGTFVEAAGATGNYDISDSSGGPMTFRSDFGTADYIGGTIPSASQNIVVIVSEFFGTVQVTARTLSDFTLDTQSFEVDSFNLYPNPTNSGFVNITSSNSDAMIVQVFDVLGKQIQNQNLIDNTLNVSNLKAGIYILKITQNNTSVTKKLVIR